MIPDSFVLRRSLPLNAAGKVDRSALPVPEKTQRGAARALVEPRNAVEKALALIWRDGLKIDAIGIDDDITQLGGDSLIAAQLVTRIAGLFPLTERLLDLFRTPTVAALAGFIIDHETQPGQAEKIAEIFLQVEAMSDAEVLRAVEDGSPAGDG
jgi:mycobactin phenyloxazoline synthetase